MAAGCRRGREKSIARSDRAIMRGSGGFRGADNWVAFARTTPRALMHRCLNIVIASAAKQSRISPRTDSGLLTWGFGVSRRMFRFLFDCCQLFVPTAGSFGWRAQIVSRSARRAAAKRLDLDASEHAIRLWWSGGCGADSSFSSGDLRFEPVFAIWFRVPDQTHIRSSRGRDCTNIPLAAGQAREDGTILRCGI
ncbi:hypothetical protein ACVWWG_005934 [Bradyrhizobium sp. LB7.2]